MCINRNKGENKMNPKKIAKMVNGQILKVAIDSYKQAKKDIEAEKYDEKAFAREMKAVINKGIEDSMKA